MAFRTGAMTGAERIFRPLPITVDSFDRADRGVGAREAERLGNAQAGAVAERQHRRVARQHPLLARFARSRLGRRHRPGVGRI